MSIQDLVSVSFVCIVIYLVIKARKKKKRDLKILYLDEGRKTPVLYSKTYDLSGKPDAIVQDAFGVVAVVEYKSRAKRIYESDIVQVKAAALVARENRFPIKYAIIKTKQDEKRIDLPKSNAALYKQLIPFISLVKEARRGKSVPANPNKYKCNACGYRYTCKQAA